MRPNSPSLQACLLMKSISYSIQVSKSGDGKRFLDFNFSISELSTWMNRRAVQIVWVHLV